MDAIEQNLVEMLRALMWNFHGESVNTKYRAFWHAGFERHEIAYSTFYNCLHNNQPPARHPLTARFRAAVRDHVDAEGIDISSVLERYRRSIVPSSDIPTALRGAWFVILFRAKRASAREDTPQPDFRVGVLIYGDDDGDKRRFQIVGENTMWEGSVRHLDGYYLYLATETTRERRRDVVTCVVHNIDERATPEAVLYHHGIANGVGRGEYDRQHFPVFASRVMFWRIAGLSHPFQEPLSDQQVTHLRAVCGYISHDELEASKGGSDLEPLVEERNQAITRFMELGESRYNSGDRDRLLIRE